MGTLALGSALLGSAGMLSAQQSFGGRPLSFSSSSLRSGMASTEASYHVALNFNVDDALLNSSWSAGKQGHAPHIGKVIECNLDFARDARLVASENGTDIYRMMVTTDGAPAGIIFYYKDFFIPQGGKLYIFGKKSRSVLGAYTTDTHPTHGSFATEPIADNAIVLQYEVPTGGQLPSVELEGLGYLYRSMFSTVNTTQDNKTPIGSGLDASDPYPAAACQINVNCPEGDNWQDQKAGIVALAQLIPSGSGTGIGSYIVSACSGNLLNNTNEDFTPYILSAAHCAGEPGNKSNPKAGTWGGKFKIPQSILNQWVFGFHYERPRCSSGNYADHQLKTMTGCSLVSYIPIYGYSDGMLLKLNQQVPEDYRVYYNGFDATSAIPSSGVGMHHPAADSKKISTYNGGVSTSSIWKTSDSEGGVQDHFSFTFASGQTEGGSSGSSLFNQDKLVIASLTGGVVAVCRGSNSYGRLFSHWDKYKSKGKQYYMAHALDPKNGGNTRILNGTWRNGYTPLQTIKAVKATLSPDGQKISLTWDALPAHSQGYPISYLVYRGEKQLKETTETTFSEDLTEEIIAKGVANYSVVPRYQISGEYHTTAPAYDNVYVGHIIRKVNDVRVVKTDNGVEVSWDPVVNAQFVSKVDITSRFFSPINVSFQGFSVPFIWVGDYWRNESFGEGPYYVAQVNFVPATNTGYTATLVLDQKGSAPVTENITLPSGVSTTEYYAHKLRKPLKLNTKQALFAGFEFKGPSMKKPYPITLVSNSKDARFETDGVHAIAGYNGMTGLELTNLDQYVFDGSNAALRRGYAAMQLVITDSSLPLREVVHNPFFARTHVPAPFPKVKGYKVFKNGNLLKEINARFVMDNDGTENDKYTVEAVYDYPSSLDAEKPILANKDVYAYPATFSHELNINDASLVQEVTIYNLQGVVVRKVTGADVRKSISTGDLAQGAYMLVFKTETGNITQKVIKK